jgi:hypothetical protein
MTKIIKQIRAYEDETVVIVWTLNDRSVYEQTVTPPPKPTREARVAKEDLPDPRPINPGW